MSNEDTVADLARSADNAATVAAADPHLLAIAIAFRAAQLDGVPAEVLIGAALGNLASVIQESANPTVAGLAAVGSLVSTLKRMGVLP